MCKPGINLDKYGFIVAPDFDGIATSVTTIEEYTSWSGHAAPAIQIMGDSLLGGCTFQMRAAVDSYSNTIDWGIVATAAVAPSTDAYSCTRFINGSTVDTSAGGMWTSQYTADKIVRAKWIKALATLSSVKRAINHCLMDNAGNKTACNSVLIAKDKLQKYGITSLPAGTGTSEGASTSDATANWKSMTLGKAGAVNAAIVIRGNAPLAECKITLQPTFDAGANYVKWAIFAENMGGIVAYNEKCATFVKTAIAGAPI
jgi:hypothetical protein